MTKILVCGSRYFGNYHLLRDVLYPYLNEVTEIIEGGARGADNLARMFASDYGIKCRTFPAKWDEYGKSAGTIRNQEMLDEGSPDLVIAFPLQNSVGTWDMVRRAKDKGVKTIVIE